MMDMVLAFLGLVLLAPIMLMVAGLVHLVMGGPAIFAHKRVGLGGRTFACYKFRTTVVEGEEEQRRHLAIDPRVDCLGNILRKSSLDQLPQLFNVLRGDMSLVGPRPVVPEEIEHYGRHAQACFRARPGLAVRQIEGGRAVIVGNSQFDILTQAALGAQVGEEAMPDAVGRPAYMAGLAFRTTSLGRAAAALRRGSIPFVERDARLVVAAREAINAVIEFVE